MYKRRPENFDSSHHTLLAGTECEDGDLRLADLSDVGFGGRLEMCFLGVWGTVCGDGWLVSNAIVACRELGFEAEGMSL